MGPELHHQRAQSERVASYDALAVTNLDAAQRQLLFVVSNVDDVPSYSDLLKSELLAC